MSDAFQKAVAAHQAGDFAAAEAGYLPFVGDYRALHNLAVLYVAAGRFAEAEAALRQVLAANPGAAPTRHSLGMLLLGDGRYAEGWPLYEARREIPGTLSPPPPVDYPEWTGGDLAGRRLLVYSEQGFGDTIQFARFLPTLAERGAEVAFICGGSLLRLFAGAGVPVSPAGSSLPAADLWTLLCSLPGRLGITPETLPPPLRLGVEVVGGGGIGVIARGRPTHANDRNRSLGPAEAAELAALGRDLSPEATGAADFLDTAHIVAGLDLVITVDTAVAHLAATLGVPTWILLPARGVDWRWGRRGHGTPWYPSVRLFRQQTHGEWGPTLAAVREALDGKDPW